MTAGAAHLFSCLATCLRAGNLRYPSRSGQGVGLHPCCAATRCAWRRARACGYAQDFVLVAWRAVVFGAWLPWPAPLSAPYYPHFPYSLCPSLPLPTPSHTTPLYTSALHCLHPACAAFYYALITSTASHYMRLCTARCHNLCTPLRRLCPWFQQSRWAARRRGRATAAAAVRGGASSS